MIPGEIIPAVGVLTLNEGAEAITMVVANTGDRPVQVGSHYHFAETNPALDFEREAAHGMRLDIAAGTAVRFEPGQRREVQLIPIGGARRIFGFNAKVMGPLAVAVGLLLGAFTVTPVQAQTAEDCVAPEAQQEMNACAAREYDKADDALNAAWIPAKAFADEIGQGTSLLAAQRAWLTYRDLACEAHSSPFKGGSLRPLIRSTCLSELTVERTAMLLEFHAY